MPEDGGRPKSSSGRASGAANECSTDADETTSTSAVGTTLAGGASSSRAHRSEVPSWVVVDHKLRWWSESQKKFMVVRVSKIDDKQRLVIVTFEADAKVWKSVPFSQLGRKGCPLQKGEEASGSVAAKPKEKSSNAKDSGNTARRDTAKKESSNREAAGKESSSGKELSGSASKRDSAKKESSNREATGKELPGSASKRDPVKKESSSRAATEREGSVKELSGAERGAGHEQSGKEGSRHDAEDGSATPNWWILEKARLLDTQEMEKREKEDVERRRKEREEKELRLEERRRLEILAAERQKVEMAFEMRKKEAEEQRLREEEEWRNKLRLRREREAAEEEERERDRELRRKKRQEEKCRKKTKEEVPKQPAQPVPVPGLAVPQPWPGVAWDGGMRLLGLPQASQAVAAAAAAAAATAVSTAVPVVNVRPPGAPAAMIGWPFPTATVAGSTGPPVGGCLDPAVAAKQGGLQPDASGGMAATQNLAGLASLELRGAVPPQVLMQNLLLQQPGHHPHALAPTQAPLAQAPLPQAPLAQASLAQAPMAQAPMAQAPLAQAPQAPMAQAPMAHQAPMAPHPLAHGIAQCLQLGGPQALVPDGSMGTWGNR